MARFARTSPACRSWAAKLHLAGGLQFLNKMHGNFHLPATFELLFYIASCHCLPFRGWGGLAVGNSLALPGNIVAACIFELDVCKPAGMCKSGRHGVVAMFRASALQMLQLRNIFRVLGGWCQQVKPQCPQAQARRGKTQELCFPETFRKIHLHS